MKGCWQHASAALVAVAVSACAPLSDEVFTAIGSVSSSPVVIDEGAGVVEIPLRLAQPREQAFSLAYHLVGIDAQDDCQEPDFGAADGRVEWTAGASEAHVPVWIADDELAERDERFELRFEPADGSSVAPLGNLEVVIADNDRSALLDAGALGVSPDVAGDQSVALQATLDQASKLGRAVVVMAPGDYDISSVSLSPGTTLSAHGVRWHRPALSPATTVSLRVQHAGAGPSPPSLVEGLTIDGRREEQGPYREHQLDDAHLVTLGGDSSQGGTLHATLERVALTSGTSSGLFLGPDSEVTVCHLGASELWRDALTLYGGATVLRVRDLDATATQGTGLWLGARTPAFDGSYRVDVEVEDVHAGAGDVEIEVSDASRVSLRRLTMTEPTFRLDAQGGSVRIEDSVLALGPPSLLSSWTIAHDVEISRTTLLAFAAAPSATPVTSSAVSLMSLSFSPSAPSPGSGHLSFVDCRFERAGNVGPGDTAYAIKNPLAGTSVTVTSSELGAGFTDWFAPECSGCVRTP
jgi:hypothetical protein